VPTAGELSAVNAAASNVGAITTLLSNASSQVSLTKSQLHALEAWVTTQFPGAIVTQLIHDPFISVKLPIPNPVLTTIAVTPTTAAISTPSGTTTFTAVGLDQNGTPLISQPTFNWNTSNTGVATISSAGVATSTGNGSTNITANVGSIVSNTVVLTVTNALATHEPAGMTTVLNGEALTSVSSVQGTFQPGTTDGNGNLVTWNNTSPNTPLSYGEAAGNLTLDPSGSGIRFNYPPTLSGGYSPARVSVGSFRTQGTGTMYVRYNITYSSNWTANGNSTTKHFDIHTSAGTENHIIYSAINTNTDMYLAVSLQFQGGAPPTYNVPTGPGPGNEPNGQLAGTTRGTKHTVETVFIQETVAGQRTGSYQSWVDGNACFGPQVNVQYLVGAETHGWHDVFFDPTYGGGSQSPPNVSPNIYWTIDHLYISVK